MTKLYLIDTENVTFQPQTAEEAIILFNRMRRKDLIKWEYVPELMQKLARDLDGPNHDLFCQWIVNPTEIKPGNPGYFAQLCQDDLRPDQQPDSEDDEKTPLLLGTSESFGPIPEGPDNGCDTGSCNETWSTSREQGTPTKPEKQ